MADALGGSVIRFMPPFASFLCLLVRVSSYLLPHEDVVVEISEHELVIIVEEFGCLLARVYFKREVLLTKFLSVPPMFQVTSNVV
ncbi:hypothetical protein ZIOFF_039914 [Zingiber officinale]|uniref:Secreted protein n=1 Tax=Zingiber officinale TaxID=94328 RepID=A0A8J5G454_ZINOF|nr:hypothetical protein ZIOFF_039914 [Zingiber officinale]